jgi:peptide/nickel transport system substrate-binding protein
MNIKGGVLMKKNKFVVASCIALIVMTVIMLLISSCQPAEKTTSPAVTTKPPAATTTPPAATTPKATPTSTPAQTTTARKSPAGILKVAMPGLEDETFLPWNGAAGRKFYIDTIFEYLVYFDPVTRMPVPGLAKSWSNSADGKTWTVKLREGVQFQENWGEFTSADVKYTFERQMEPSSKASQASTFRDFKLTITTPDKYTAVFNISTADFLFWNRLCNNISNHIVCKAYVEKVGDTAANDHPIGTGPYTLAEHKRGVSIKVTTVPGVENHWRVTPDFKDIIFYGVPEESTRVAMLKVGEADMAPISLDSVNTVTASKFNILSQKDSWAPRILIGGLIQTDTKRYNPTAPWAKKEVRQALNYAVDKEAIVRNIFRGQARANFDPHSFENLIAAAYPYDAAKAKQMLTAAGYPNGFQVNLYTCPRNPGAQLPDIGLVVATYWEAVGVKVKVTPTDYPTIRAAWNAGKANDMFWTHTYNAPISPDDAGGLTAAYTDKSVFAIFTSAELDKMAISAQAEPDSTKRTALMTEINKYLLEQADFIYLLSAVEPFAVNPIISSWPTITQYPTNFDSITKAK